LLVDQLFDRVWLEGGDLGDLGELGELNAFSTQPLTTHSKKRFKEGQEKALQLGVYGVPTFIYEGELYWGTECLETLNKIVKNEMEHFRPTETSEYEKFLNSF
jgi:protein-disulfide isomerase